MWRDRAEDLPSEPEFKALKMPYRHAKLTVRGICDLNPEMSSSSAGMID
jgi:hypothetical protein